MNVQLDDSTNKRYQDLAKGKKPSAMDTEIYWITPKRLGILFAVCLLMTVLTNGV
jgi:hypothetical protein